MEFQGQTVPESPLCFKTLAGEIEPISDYVTLGKQPPGTLKNSTRIRLIDSPTFLPDLSIREHLHLMGMPKNPESFNAFAPWKLDEIYDHPPSWLSNGQKQRAFLCGQLQSPAEFMLFDEPERHLNISWLNFTR